MKFESLDGYCLCHVVSKKKVAKEILRKQRVLHEMTQQQVADKAGIKIQQYQKFESGERNIFDQFIPVGLQGVESIGNRC